MACAECPTCLIDRLPEGGPEVGHEIHITVGSSGPSDFSHFQHICSGLSGVRAHGMELVIDSETSQFEMMTGHSIRGSDRDAVRTLILLGDVLEERGFDPVRVKIESVPWHPLAPQKVGDPMPAGAYWESHIGLWLTAEAIDQALELVRHMDGYLSLNRGKPARTSARGPQFRASATLRSTLSREEQEAAAESMRLGLRRLVGDVDTSVRTEFTWLDLAEDSARVGGPPVLAAA